MTKRIPLLVLSTLLLVSCGSNGSSNASGYTETIPAPSTSMDSVPVELVSISKDEYRNKTLGGLLGHMAGFLSGYEFVWDGPMPRIMMPDSWFKFCYGPYAGNFENYDPGGGPAETNPYNRLKNTGLKGEKEVASDDDYHLDIFAQTIMNEYGFTSKAITDAWYDYKVYDWGGGNDAMALINKNRMLAPYTGKIESGNRYGWCTEAYIENETLGMDAGGMPNVAVNLTDTFASNVGYYDSIIWAKFYSACYSIAYFDNDVYSIIEKAKKAMPKGSWPRQMFDIAKKAYEDNPHDMETAAWTVVNARRNLYRLDNIQCDPSVNGGFAILSLLYAGNNYMNACKYSSLMGFDGDCTAATVTSILGIINGFKKGNPEYQTINDSFYHDGEGTYYNDQNYTTRIGNVEKYGLHIKLDDIVDLYVKNFETLLAMNGGTMDDNNYYVPVSDLKEDSSVSFPNNDGENRNLENWQTNGNGTFTNIEDTVLDNIHAGSFGFKLVNGGQTSAFHHFNNLRAGSYYRVSTYVKTNPEAVVLIYANDGTNPEQTMSFANCSNLLNKEFIFKATSNSMDVGFKFGLTSKNGDTLYFDDFFVEEIDYTVLSKVESSTMPMATGSITKPIAMPSNYREGEEVVLRFKFAQKTGGTVTVGFYRNNALYGSVLASNTGYSLTTLSSYIDVPYVFEKSTDYVKLSFDGLKIAFGEIDVIKKVSYQFR